MIKCTSVFTCENNDPDAALTEIRDQLEKKITLLGSSVGIITCHPDFINTGVLRYICENLPFDLVGITTISQAVNDCVHDTILTIFVMTADDVQFRAGVTKSVMNDITGPVRNAYNAASRGISDKPKLALIFPPLLLGHSADEYVKAWEEVAPRAPVFGGLAVDKPPFTHSETIHNGINYKAAMPFVLCYGNINPRFLLGTIPTDRPATKSGEITKSRGTYVYEINKINARKYFENHDFVKKLTSFESLIYFPFLVNFIKRSDYDGVSVIRALGSFTKDGTAIFRGNMDEGSTFTITTFDSSDVFATLAECIEKINKLPAVNGVLMLPCLVRFLTLPVDSLLKELQTVSDTLNPEIPYMMSYAGGEICPTSLKNGVAANRFHNYSLAILVI